MKKDALGDWEDLLLAHAKNRQPVELSEQLLYIIKLRILQAVRTHSCYWLLKAEAFSGLNIVQLYISCRPQSLAVSHWTEQALENTSIAVLGSARGELHSIEETQTSRKKKPTFCVLPCNWKSRCLQTYLYPYSPLVQIFLAIATLPASCFLILNLPAGATCKFTEVGVLFQDVYSSHSTRHSI